MRSLIYVRLPEGAFDERGFRMLKIIRESRKANERLSLPRFKEMVREQHQLLVIDEERAINALPKLVEAGEPEAATALDALHRLIAARGLAGFRGQAPTGAGRGAARRKAAVRPKPESRQCLTHQPRTRPDRTTNTIA